MTSISVIIPAKNEAATLGELLLSLQGLDAVNEIIVVDDGSTDTTVQIAEDLGVRVVLHRYSMGNGAAIKSGVRAATGDVLIMMDADGQHKVEDITRLIQTYNEGYDMVIGARDSGSQADIGRWAANKIYNKLASWIVGHKIKDLTSGFRVVNAKKFKEFLYMLPNGFSYPTTSTMAFFRAGYSVRYVPIVANKREGNSHVSILKDGIKFLLIIFRVGTLYSPLKIFFPVSLTQALLGLSYYLFTYLNDGRFTNMGMLLFISSILILLIGLISEQITYLLYKKED